MAATDPSEVEARATALALFEPHQVWAIRMAMNFSKRNQWPASCWDEIKNSALVGLWIAAMRFRADKGTQFKSFAYGHILGRIRDELRDREWWSRQKYYEECGITAPGKFPTAKVKFVGGIASEYSRNQGGLAWDQIAGQRSTFEDELNLSDEMIAAMNALPPAILGVLRMQFFEKRAVVDIAAELGVSDARVWQMRRQGLDLMRVHLSRKKFTGKGSNMKASKRAMSEARKHMKALGGAVDAQLVDQAALNIKRVKECLDQAAVCLRDEAKV